MADSPGPPAQTRPQLHGPIGRIAAGLPASVGIMQLLAECEGPGEAEDALLAALRGRDQRADRVGAGRLDDALALLRANPQAFHVVRSVLSGLDHGRQSAGEADELAYWAAAFDRAARQNPEGSVALYSLGNPDLLAAATDEVVRRLGEWGLISPQTVCLDLGCGIGRFELALAPVLASMVGIDISAAMVETARARCARLANVEIRQASGRDLALFSAESFDLVLAIDAFPYVVQAGADLVRTILSECCRVLRPGGNLAILNFSYRGDLGRDRNELRALSTELGLRTVRDGTSEFALWDGATFVLEKL